MAEHNHSTDCVHGAPHDHAPGTPVAPSMVRSTAFRLSDEVYRQRREGRDQEADVYAREGNPTVRRVERHLAHLEGAEQALLFASGMAALHGILMGTLAQGQNVVLAKQAYGGTASLVKALLPRLGVELRLVDVFDLPGIEAALDAKTRVFACEGISNPLTRVADLPRIAALLDRLSPEGLLVVDGTMTSPAGQQPLAQGADLVWHSASKYLAGHSDVIAGVVCGGAELLGEIHSWRSRAGGCLDPEAAWLLERGLKTLVLRLRAASQNGLAVARFLEQHAEVLRVDYCGLAGHPDEELVEQLVEHIGGLLSFVVKGGDERALRLIRKLKIFTEAASLGGVESLVTRPRDMSQSWLNEAERTAIGIPPGSLRLALGIEDAADLVADLAQAFEES